MSDLRDLYQEVLLDHYRQPRNQVALGEPGFSATGHNPLCGDQVKVSLRVADERVAEIAFAGSGCAISVAAASLMTEAVKGKTVAEAEALFRRFQDLVTAEPAGGALGADDPVLGKLVIFAGVREFPSRVKCATLPWHTLRAALAQGSAPVSTE